MEEVKVTSETPKHSINEDITAADASENIEQFHVTLQTAAVAAISSSAIRQDEGAHWSIATTTSPAHNITTDNDNDDHVQISELVIGVGQDVELPSDRSYISDLRNKTKKNKTTISSYFYVKMIVQHSREFVCLLALLLTTYATIQNSRQPKIAGAPIPKPIFGKGSLVEEWSDGQLSQMQAKVASSELSLIFFYAPWCAESLFAKSSFNAATNLYYKEIYFAAVNCWQPGGDCRAYYSKVYKWPVLMAYFPKGFAVQYNGEWDFNSMLQFIDGLLAPITRIHNNQELLRLRIENDAVVLGVFEKIDCAEYQKFFKTAIKWLEVDPLQSVRFAVYVGRKTTTFKDASDSVLPFVKLYNANETLVFNQRNKWDADKIVSWIKTISLKSRVWLDVPSIKSSPLAPYFNKGPVLLMFSPRNMYNNDYLMIKQIMYIYENCQKDPIVNVLINYIPYLRTENQKKLSKLVEFCKNSQEKQKAQRSSIPCSVIKNYNRHQFYSRNVATLNTSKLKGPRMISKTYCNVEQSSALPADQEYDLLNDPDVSCSSKQSAVAGCTESSHTQNIDPRSPLGLLRNQLDRHCAKLAKQQWQLQGRPVEKEFDDVNIQEELNGLKCKSNRSLSFLMLDNLLHFDFVQKFTGKLQISLDPASSLLFIIDDQDESIFMMRPIFSVTRVMKFIDNFFKGLLKRHQRSAFLAKPSQQTTISNSVRIFELNSRKFLNVIRWKNATLVIMVYSPHCALCTVMSQILLQVSMTMTTINRVHFFRIDASANDLPWEYTMDTYPTLLVFPRNRTTETKVFPTTMRVNEKNIFGFIVANLDPTEQLKALLTACVRITLKVPLYNCMRHLRVRIDDEIERQLQCWRRSSENKTTIFERLKVLKKMHLVLQSAKHGCDLRFLLQSKYLEKLDRIW